VGAWRYRVAKDGKEGKLHFVYARYDTVDPNRRRGMIGIFNEGNDVADMRQLAQQLLAACNEPIIPLEEYRDEGSEEDEDEEEVN
jgi:hypothetical protein